MKANEVLRKFFKKHGTKKLAAALGLSEPFLYKWCQPDGGKGTGGWNPLERVAALTQATGDEALLDWLCQQADGRFVRSAELPPFVRRCWNQMIAEMEGFLKREVRPPKAPVAAAAPDAARCRHRLPNGRCGFRFAGRNQAGPALTP